MEGASKQRKTILFCINMNGSDKQTPLIVGKSQNPECFKEVEALSLPVTC